MTTLFIHPYSSPLGQILLAADEAGLVGAWFEGQKYFPQDLASQGQRRDLAVFQQAERWLDLYFSGRDPDFMPPLHLSGTPFQQKVWQILTTIPYGQTITYGEIGARLGIRSGQAVGGAVGRNPLSIFVPCHRVVGAKGNLTGYAGGLDKKTALLRLEGVDVH